jgi:hypothetical protein
MVTFGLMYNLHACAMCMVFLNETFYPIPFDNMVFHIIKYVSTCDNLIVHDNISPMIIFGPHDNNQSHIKTFGKCTSNIYGRQNISNIHKKDFVLIRKNETKQQNYDAKRTIFHKNLTYSYRPEELVTYRNPDVHCF